MKKSHLTALLTVSAVVMAGAVFLGHLATNATRGAGDSYAHSPPAGDASADVLTGPGTAVDADVTAITREQAGSDAPCRMSPDDEGAWHVHLSTTSVANTGNGAQHATRTNHERSATLVTRTLQASEDAAVLLARWHNPTLTEHPNLEGPLSTPFLFRLGGDCSIRAFAHHQHTPLGVARHQQALLWELTWQWTDDPSPVAFDNDTGAHQRTHVLARDSRGLLAQRSVRIYDRTWDGQVDLAPVISLLNVRPEGATWFREAQGEELLRVPGGTVHSTLRASAVPVPHQALAGASDDRAHYHWAHLLPRAHSARRAPLAVTAEDLEARAALAHLDASAAVEMMIDRSSAGDDWQDLLPVMSLWLEARPDQTEDLAHLIASAGLPTQADNTLYMALGLARTPQAREWLHVIMDDPAAPPTHRTRAMVNLLDRDDVGQPLARSLAQRSAALVDGGSHGEIFMARQSLLALGTMAAIQQDPEITALAEEVALRTLAIAQETGTVRPAVGAIANIGDPRLLPEVDRLTRHPEWEVRMAAARAFRRMHPDDTEDFVLEWLQREPSAFVRGELWTTIARQHRDADTPPSEALATLAAAHLHMNMDVGPQSSVIHLIGPLAAEHPILRESLMRLAREERDTRSNLINAIARYLDHDAIIEVFQ